MPVTKRDFIRLLKRLGFTEVPGKDHLYFELRFTNRIIRTKVSHGRGKDISNALLSHILRNQIYLTKAEFNRAKQGQLSRAEYLEILREKELIN
jgi:predicted RNA binding protein YcfA (HicA-like mRNA interferase family)